MAGGRFVTNDDGQKATSRDLTEDGAATFGAQFEADLVNLSPRRQRRPDQRADGATISRHSPSNHDECGRQQTTTELTGTCLSSSERSRSTLL